MSEPTGKKNDADKPDLTLVPNEAYWGMAQALTYGAKKYGRHNFKGGIAYSRLAAACLRHLTAYMGGETIDIESGNNHLTHALASLGMLAWMEQNKPEMDDRYKGDDHVTTGK